MATLRTSDFDGTDGAAWPLSSGSWTHVTESGTFSVTTEDILSNNGRGRYTNTVVGVRRNHADSTFTVLNGEVRAEVTRVGVSSSSYGPGVFLRATGHAGSSDSYYALRLSGSSVGKANLYGFQIRRVLSGTHTIISSEESVPNLDTTVKVNLAFRATNVNGGVDCLLQGKVWADGDSEPAWVQPGDVSVEGSVAVYDSSLLSAGESGVLTYLDTTVTASNVNTWHTFSLADSPEIDSVPRRIGGFSNVKELVDAELNGRVQYRTWRKSPTQTTTPGVWFDLSMSPGNPIPQYYAASPLESVALSRSADGGLDHGPNVAPSVKYLRRMTVLTGTAAPPTPMPMMVLDYLLFYPFIDEGTTDTQTLTTSVTLPRWTDGEGVQIMAVSVAGRTGGQSFTVSYTNSNGVSGRTTAAALQNTVSVNGSIVTSAQASAGSSGPFLSLQNGDTGVRSIESVTMLGTDVGLFTLVLVKPVAQLQLRGPDAPVEVDYFLDFGQAPVIADDAYLNLLCNPQGSLAATALHGDITVAWN